jgi:hypothetical protein
LFLAFRDPPSTATQGKIMATSTESGSHDGTHRIRKKGVESAIEARPGVTMYRRTLAAVITAFTGISDPFEPPAKPDLELHTDDESVEESVERVLPLSRERGYDA